MKKILSILCLLGVVVLFTACDNGDSGGSSGGAVPEVSYDLYDTSNWVTCYNASRSVITNPYQSCEWDCATFNGSQPHYIKMIFFWDEATDEYSVNDLIKGPCRL